MLRTSILMFCTKHEVPAPTIRHAVLKDAMHRIMLGRERSGGERGISGQRDTAFEERI
ncbi:hypothetical protein BIL_09930 [Bifidobacterium longum subsp. longum F8]|nr:hypothetical protein BIL_09930 [Bifidobacterium longum subsp. longum F8]